MIDYKNKYLKYKQKYVILKNNIGGTLNEKSSDTSVKKYNSSEINKSTTTEERYTEKKLADNANSARTRQEEALAISKEIQDSKNIRSATFMVATASKALAILPGGVYLAGALNVANIMAEAYTDSLKFKELLYDTMIILTNCYKIFVLINRATDTFTIAIHNKSGLNDLYNMINSKEYDDKKYNEEFIKQLEIATDKKEKHREEIKNDQRNPYYLLDNIHQSHEIKEEIKIKMEKLMGLLLESAPDSVILTLYLDKTLKQQGFGDLIITECIQRRSDKTSKDTNFCINKDDATTKDKIKKLEETEHNIEDNEIKEVKGFFTNIKSKISDLSKKVNPLNLYNKINKISESTEKMQETLVALSVINGLFIIMKTQYDEVIKYYEKHLDNILSNENENIKIKQRVLYNNNELSIYEKASYLIDFSNEYINFMVPPQLQSTINIATNNINAVDMEKAMTTVSDDIKKDGEERDRKQILEKIRTVLSNK